MTMPSYAVKLFTVTAVLVLLMPSAAAAKKAKKKVSPQTLAKKKLQAIRIVEMNFEKAALSDVLKKLADRSKEVDPEDKGFAFILPTQPMKITAGFGKPQRVAEPKITIRLANVNLGGAIDQVCRQAKLRWTLMPGKIIIRPEKQTADSGRNKAALNMQKRLKAIVIPRASFEDTSMPQALDHIAKLTKKIDVDSEGVDFHLHYYPNLLISPDKDLIRRGPAEKKLTMDFDNLPLADVLRYIGRLTKLTVRVASDGIHLYR